MFQIQPDNLGIPGSLYGDMAFYPDNPQPRLEVSDKIDKQHFDQPQTFPPDGLPLLKRHWECRGAEFSSKRLRSFPDGSDSIPLTPHVRTRVSDVEQVPPADHGVETSIENEHDSMGPETPGHVDLDSMLVDFASTDLVTMDLVPTDEVDDHIQIIDEQPHLKICYGAVRKHCPKISVPEPRTDTIGAL